MTDLLGRVRSSLADRYAVKSSIGEGGTAVVFLADDLKHRRPVAVKVLKPDVVSGLGAERFLREIEFAARLSHPHILSLIDSGVADGLPFYVMPYVESNSLRTRLQRERCLPFSDAVQIARAVAAALDYAHRAGVVHRDIKPENILLHDGLPVVADFGIATALLTAGDTRFTATGVAVGTPAYMSPEQVTGDDMLDGRSDLYALGCVLYEMLAGEPPFRGASAQAILTQRLVGPVPRVSAARPEVPREVEDVLLRTMARDPEGRFATGAQFAQALATALGSGRRATPAEQSLAVLPFVNLSADPENEYFSDGVTEEIINALAQVPGLRVTSRTSTFAFKGTQSDVRDIGHKLNVAQVLEGSVRRAGHRIRITAQLVDVAAGHQLWSQRFDRDLQDIFAVQDEIADQIAKRLQAALGATMQRRERGTSNLDAYDAYLRGRFEFNKGTPDSFAKSCEDYQRATQLDPLYAEAHLGLAETMLQWGFHGADLRVLIPKIRAAVARALELNDQLPEAHATLGYVNFWFDWKWAEAERCLARALELGPNSATTHNYYVVVLANLGRHEEAISHGRRNIELDPFSAWAHHSYGWALCQSGRYAEAIAADNRALALAPDSVLSHSVKGISEVESGMYDEALASFQRACAVQSGDPIAMAGLVQTFSRMGRPDQARQVMREMQDRAATSFVNVTALVWAHCALDETEEAFALLPKIREQRDLFVVAAATFKWWDPLRNDQRFRDFLRQLEFPAWSVAISEARAKAWLGKRS